MPRAIAPEVTTTTSTPGACSAATSSQIRATTDSRSAPVSSATIDEPSLTTATGIDSRRDRARRRCRRSRRRRRPRSPPAPARRSRPCAAGGPRRSACASSFSRSQRMIRRSTESPVTIQPPSGPRVMSNACDFAGRKTANSATSSSPTPAGSGSATGTRPSSSLRSSSRPSRVALEVTSTGNATRARHSAAAAAATSGVTRSALDSASSRGSPASRGSCSASSRSITSKLRSGSQPSSGARSSTCTSSRVRSTCARKSWPRPAPPEAPSISPGMSASTELPVVGVDRPQHRLQRRERDTTRSSAARGS